ncbi:MAG: A24 family peptidase [Acidimicrobiia bacterium]
MFERLDPSRRLHIAATVVGLTTITSWRLGMVWQLPAYLALATLLVPLSVIDLDTKTLPRPLVYAIALSGLLLLVPAALLAGEPKRIWWGVIGAVGALVVLWFLYATARGRFGFGDVRLGAVLGGHLGWLGLRFVPVGIFLGFVLASVAGVALIVSNRATRNSSVPFGPFLAAGALVTIVAGQPLVDAMLR